MPRTLQELFVDRDRQLEAFRRMLDGQSRRRIMIIPADQGMGKTWLLQTFEHEANARGLPTVYVDFGDGESYDAFALVRRFRDTLGAQHFVQVDQAFVAATVLPVNITSDQPAVNINVAGSTLTESPINVQNVNTTIADNTFIVQTNNPIIRQAQEARLTTAFFNDLAALSARQPVVFLFDTYERTSLQTGNWVPGEADRWIVGQLLARMREQHLSNVVVVLAGERMPAFDVVWNDVLGRMPLDPLQCTDVDEYLRKRRGLVNISDSQIQVLCQAVNGIPQMLGLIGDNLEQKNAAAPADDAW